MLRFFVVFWEIFGSLGILHQKNSAGLVSYPQGSPTPVGNHSTLIINQS